MYLCICVCVFVPRQEEGENQSQETGSQESSLGSIVPIPSPLSQFLPLRNSPEPSSDAPSPPPAQDLSFLDDMPTQQEAGSKVGDPLDDGDEGVIITIIITITTTIITKKNPKFFFSRNEIYMP